METETLQRGRLAVTNPMDDTHKTFKHLKKAGITEAQAEVFTETFKGLADQTTQVNENLLMVRDELRGEITGMRDELRGEITGMRDELRGEITGVRDEFRKEFTEVRNEITGIRGELKDIHHNAASNYQKLDAKIDGNYQSLDHKIDTNQKKLETDIALVRKELAFTNQEGIHTREALSTQIDAKFAQPKFVTLFEFSRFLRRFLVDVTSATQ